jgi:tryptophan synthase beta chain
LDYAAVGPEHVHFFETGRASYISAGDAEALAAFSTLSELEGIIPALESAHAVAGAIQRAPEMKPGQIILLNLSGRGDKDLQTVMEARA